MVSWGMRVGLEGEKKRDPIGGWKKKIKRGVGEKSGRAD